MIKRFGKNIPALILKTLNSFLIETKTKYLVNQTNINMEFFLKFIKNILTQLQCTISIAELLSVKNAWAWVSIVFT